MFFFNIFFPFWWITVHFYSLLGMMQGKNEFICKGGNCLVQGFGFFDFFEGIHTGGHGDKYTAILLPFSFLIASSSGTHWLIAQHESPLYLNAFLVGVLIVGTLFDGMALMLVSKYNSKKGRTSKNPQKFKWIFVFWRVFLPDFLVGTTLTAYFMKVQLSKKEIFLLTFITQLLRLLLFILPLKVFYSGTI